MESATRLPLNDDDLSLMDEIDGFQLQIARVRRVIGYAFFWLVALWATFWLAVAFGAGPRTALLDLEGRSLFFPWVWVEAWWIGLGSAALLALYWGDRRTRTGTSERKWVRGHWRTSVSKIRFLERLQDWGESARRARDTNTLFAVLATVVALILVLTLPLGESLWTLTVEAFGVWFVLGLAMPVVGVWLLMSLALRRQQNVLLESVRRRLSAWHLIPNTRDPTEVNVGLNPETISRATEAATAATRSAGDSAVRVVIAQSRLLWVLFGAFAVATVVSVVLAEFAQYLTPLTQGWGFFAPPIALLGLIPAGILTYNRLAESREVLRAQPREPADAGVASVSGPSRVIAEVVRTAKLATTARRVSDGAGLLWAFAVFWLLVVVPPVSLFGGFSVGGLSSNVEIGKVVGYTFVGIELAVAPLALLALAVLLFGRLCVDLEQEANRGWMEGIAGLERGVWDRF